MSFNISDHAQSELERRHIPRLLLDSVLAAPEQKAPETETIVCYQWQAVLAPRDGGRSQAATRRYNGLQDKQNREILETDMKVTYNPAVDVLRIIFRDSPVEESDQDKPGVILDYDKDGNIVGLEVLNASTRVENPRGVEYAMAGN